MKRLAAALLLALGLAGQVIAQAPPPIPALPDTQRLTQYSISGTTCACSVGFALYADASGTTDVDNWIQVWINGVQYLSTDPAHGWALSSATGSLGSIARPITDAVLTFNATQTGTVQILGARRPRRVSQFAENRGVPARDLNQAVTDLVAQNREQWDRINRTIIGQPGEVLNTLPLAATRANTLLGFNASGQPSLYVNTITGIIATTCPAHQWFDALASNGSFTCVQPTFADIASTPTTLGGYGITNARTQLTASQNYWVNGNSGATAACGPTGASTCSAGSDSNNCLTPGTACLTLQHVVNIIIDTIDLNGFNVAIYLAHNTGTQNYAFVCQGGPVIGQSVFSINGDSSAPTTVVMQATSAVAVVKDGCTVGINNVAMKDNGSNNASAFIAIGTGQYGHVDASNITFGALGIGSAITATYGGSLTLTGSNSVTGSEGAFAQVASGGVIDISGTVNGSASITWGTAAAIVQSGGQIVDVSGSTFTGFSGVSGPRCLVTSAADFGGLANPNSLFPGSTNCVMNSLIVGALGVQVAPSSVGYGSSGQCLTSGGGSSALNTWANCAGAGVPQNNLNTQSGNYTIQTTDCGNTINATGAMKTITLPAVAGFATNCVLSVYNASSTRGQILSGFPGALSAAPNNILWSLDTITVEIVNGAWSIQSYVTRHKITASTTVYVDNTNGNDSNDCLAVTTSACKTIQGAINYVQTWDGNTQAITVSVADGTYTNAVTINGPFHGNPTVTLQGDLATPANCTISTTSASAITATNGATISVGGFTLTAATSGFGIQALNASFVTVNGAMVYGATANAHLSAGFAATISITSNYTISGNAPFHWNATQAGSISASSLTITTSGTPAFSTDFVRAINGGQISAFNDTFSGTGATGTRFSASLGGVIFTNQTSATYFPGNAAGTVASGGRIDGIGTPGISSCGGSPGSATGTDFSGSVVEGSTATGCTITFATASTMKACTVSLSTGAAVGISTLGATLVVVHASLSGNTLYWTCAN